MEYEDFCEQLKSGVLQNMEWNLTKKEYEFYKIRTLFLLNSIPYFAKHRFLAAHKNLRIPYIYFPFLLFRFSYFLIFSVYSLVYHTLQKNALFNFPF